MNQYQQDHGNAPEQVKGRFLVFVIILILMFAYLFVGLVNLQLKSSEGYSTKTESTRLKTIPLTGKRGNITDANSVILATDEMVYNVTFYKDASESSSSVYKTYTQSIIDTLKIVERNGGKLAFSYVIQRSEETGEWEFNFGSGVSEATLQTRESQWRSNNYVTAKSYPTPEDCLVTLKHRYRMVNSAEEEEEVRAAYIEKRGDDSGYVPCIIVDENTMLKVMAVFSEMQMNLYNSLPITIAKNVPFETVTEIETKSMMLPGMDISESTQRVYPKQTLAAQVIGYIGKIPSRTMWLTLQAKGYSYNDTIGRDGIESSMEDWLTQNSSLRKGSRVVERNNWSKIVREISYTEPSDGNNVKLTLDVNYQTVAERAIASNVARIRDKQEDLMVSSKWLEDNRTLIATYDWEHYPLELAEHGVMLVLDMQARVLAMANYPTYDLNALVAGGDEARAILSDDRNLMLNYAIGSRATPGSIFKMVTGFGALDSGVLKPDEMISDMGYYTAYNSDLSTAPKCWISEGYRSQHYYQTIVAGLEHSCNYFFYEVGRLTGIKTLDDYATQFGLGQYTGIEIGGPNSAEAKGALASPEYAEANDLEWSDGQTLTAAIGQSYNLFTPLQLANYIATLVGNGEHYAAHLLKNIKTYNNSAVVYAYDKDPVNVVEMQDSTVEAIKTGMHDLTTGSLSTYFSKCVVSAGAKTGTAETGVTNANNGTFVCFAPYDDPQIAVAVVIEKGGAGAALAETAVDILNAYFSREEIGTAIIGENTLLN